MSGSSGLTEKDDFVTIAAALQPKTREEGSYRLAYLTATLSMLSADCISDCLVQFRLGRYGQVVAALANEPIPHDRYADAIKHLTCIILYLISFEQGPECPEWLADFLGACVCTMDQVVQGTPVTTIMGRYGLVSGEKVYAVAARNLMEDLGFAAYAEAAGRHLDNYLRESAGFRSQVLYFALSQERDFIEKRWREIVAQNASSPEQTSASNPE
jgi:hypothetical protein